MGAAKGIDVDWMTVDRRCAMLKGPLGPTAQKRHPDPFSSMLPSDDET